MTREEAKKAAEIMLAFAEGKEIQTLIGEKWVDCTDIGRPIEFNWYSYSYRIKPESKTRRMTQQELADWLRDEPQEHREYKYRQDEFVGCRYGYFEGNANDAVGDIVICRNHGEWEEPVIEIK